MSVVCEVLAQNGKVLEGKVIKSAILGKDVKYSIYLPADYDVSQRKYPVIYLLHGYSDDETAWVQFGSANTAADQLIKNGEINPVIIVMPYGRLDWYVNDYAGKTKWMDMFTKEMIPQIDANYRTKANRDYRAISGLSMGGYGSLINCLYNPNLFSSCAALSSGVWTEKEIVEDKEDNYDNPWWPKGSIGKARLTENYYKYSVIEQMSKMPLDSIKKVRWYIDCGDKDFLAIGNAQLHIVMRERNINHEYRVRAGWHNWDYWRTGIYDALKFICQGFDRR
ncbi:MAG: alpha/beta hydrolase-fold protein [Bacteroidota bacterium]|nr:alpha/beta hydrolase-fold protein [Bacteroidota bacterium]